MKLIQVISYVGDESAGPSYSGPKLFEALANNGQHGVEFHTLAPIPSLPDNFKTFSYPRHRWPTPTYGRSPEMLVGLTEACHNANIIHNHGLWMAPNIYAEVARRGTRAKLVVGPRGCLAAWALGRSKWKKRVVWLLGQKQALLRADMLHATSVKEYEEIREFGLTQPVVVLPNGIDLPEPMPLPAKSDKMKLLFLGRLHPVKGLDILLRTWSSVAENFPQWQLEIVGPGKGGYPDYLRELTAELQAPRVVFTPEVNGPEKYLKYRSADLYILPSHTENFGMTVAEAQACGVPVITTTGTLWSDLVREGSGWWIELGEETLEKCLREALSLNSEVLRSMGTKGREWMQREFSWSGIAAKMIQAYEWLLNGGERLQWIMEE